MQYIKADYAILTVVLFCLTRVLLSIKKISPQYKLLVLTGCGVLLACLSAVSRSGEYANWMAALFDGLVQGILCTGLSVYLNEMILHWGTGGCACRKKDEDEEE